MSIQPIIVGSSNSKLGIEPAIDILRRGGTALDAVEAGARAVEANPADHTVGYNGFPNILGDAQLDASIMDGRTLETGAVAALERYMHPISVARKVMEKLPHVLLVGDGATRFAREMGFPDQGSLLLDDVRQRWRERLEKDVPHDVRETLAERDDLWRWVRIATDPERAWSTVNFIARDAAGNIASAVSTSGWAWKYPGRVGDSPLIGAGNYADNRYGAAACTGMGEMAIRASTARSIVLYMKMGFSLDAACSEAMSDLRDLGGPFAGVMHLVALDKDGNHAGYTSRAGWTYVWQAADMPTYEETERRFVALPYRWEHDV